MNELPKERFRKFVETLLKGGTAQDAFIETYGDKFNDFDKFKTKFAAFSK